MTIKEKAELVVAAPHLRLVLGALAEAHAGQLCGPAQESAALGLALVPVTDPVETARLLEIWCRQTCGVTGDVFQGHRRPDPRPELALDRILWNLRAGFGSRYANWTPTIGKNRSVGRVAGPQATTEDVSVAGEVSHGGGGAPTALADPPAWARARGEGPGAGVTVGLVDTAIYSHDYLSGAWVARYADSIWPDEPPLAEAGHATFVSGLVLRYAPSATLQVRRLLDPDGMADSWTAANTMVEAGRTGVDIHNLSFVCYTDHGVAPRVIATAIDRLDPDIVVVAAAGNHGFLPGQEGRKPAWPAALDNVLAVGATERDHEYERAALSPDAAWVDVLAPGVDVESTYLRGEVLVWDDAYPAERNPGRTFAGFARWSGTSFAAGIVSGAIAARTTPGKVSAAEARDQLLAQAREQQGMLNLPEHPAFLSADWLAAGSSRSAARLSAA
jgi:hypothetical protein